MAHHQRTRGFAMLATLMILWAVLAPADAHITKKVGHTWKHIRAKADQRYPTKGSLSSDDGLVNEAGDPVHWSNLAGIPTGFADGIDQDGGTASDLDCPGCVGTTDIGDDQVTGGKIPAGEITQGKLSFDPTTQGELDDHKASDDHDGRYYAEAEADAAFATAGHDHDGRYYRETELDASDPGSNRVHWNNLGGVPAGFADGTDDGGSPAWLLAGNAGTTPASEFVGTSDNQPLSFRVNNLRALWLAPNGTSPSLIGGFDGNFRTSGTTRPTFGATVGGGGAAGDVNAVTDDYGTVGGGLGNEAGNHDSEVDNRPYATVSGGWNNFATEYGATVGGGTNNGAGGTGATIGGGQGNSATGSADTVAGGDSNIAGSLSGGATVGGGGSNSATGTAATVPGGTQNAAAGDFSVASGRRAKIGTAHDGSFLFADATDADFNSAAANEFAVRAGGGVRFEVGANTCSLNSGTGAWAGSCAAPAAPSAWLLGGNAGTTAGANFVGTTDNIALEVKVNGSRAFRFEPASTPNLIGGHPGNNVTAGAFGATIAGGGETGLPNQVTDEYGTISGGRNNLAGNGNGNTVDTTHATVAGGSNNAATGTSATIGGGASNTSSEDSSTVAGGISNTASGSRSAIGGGNGNTASCLVCTIGGGQSNTASGFGSSTVAGGSLNTASLEWTTVGGGVSNTANALAAVVAGGNANESLGQYSAIGGGKFNRVSAQYGTIAGGAPSNSLDPGTRNHVTDEYGTIGGGGNNQAGDGTASTTDATFATVGGGDDNTASGVTSTVGGGDRNTATSPGSTVAGGILNAASAQRAVVGGGQSNTASGGYSTVSGGQSNAAGGQEAAIAGGFGNSAGGARTSIGGGEANSATVIYSTIGGGKSNAASGGAVGYATVGGGFSNNASGAISTIGGGDTNFAAGHRGTVAGGEGNSASGDRSTVGGGSNNGASGTYTAVPGGFSNGARGNFSFAAGRRADATASHHGAFVWSDSCGNAAGSATCDVGAASVAFSSTAVDEFSARATGGVRFATAVDSSGTPTGGASLAAGASAWGTLSDRASKEHVALIDGRDVLHRLSTVPVATWNWKTQDDSVRHIGPMAQDFSAAFGVGEDERHISTVDADGVALAAIQGLNEIVTEQQQTIETLETEIEDRARPSGAGLPLWLILLGAFGLLVLGTGMGVLGVALLKRSA